MSNYLTNLAQHIRAEHGDTPAQILVCLPTRRAVYAFQQIAAPLWANRTPPTAVAIQDWVLSLSTLQPVSSIVLTQLLYDAYRQSGGGDSVEDFLPAAATMLMDFEEIDMQLADGPKLYDYLSQLKSLNTFLEDATTLSGFSKQYRHFWSMFRGCYERLRATLLAQQIGYPGMRYREVAERIHSIPLSFNKIYFAGLSGLTLSEDRIIKYLIRQRVASFCTDTDKYYLYNKSQEAGTAFRQHKKNWGIETFYGEGDYLSTIPKQIQIIGVAGTTGQAMLTADILAHHLGADATNTVIVLPDQQLLSPLLAHLPDGYDQINVTMGLPIADTQPAQWIRRLHDLQEHTTISRAGNVRCYHSDVIAMVSHPYFALLAGRGSEPDELIKYIRKHNKISITLDEIHTHIGGDTSLIALLFTPVSDSMAYLHQLHTLLEKLHTAMTNADLIATDRDQQAVAYLLKSIVELRDTLSTSQTGWTADALRMLLLAEIKQGRLAYEGSYDAGLQVMGMLETRCLDFKNVIILSLNEDTYPTSKQQASFLPFEVRQGNLSTHREREADSAYLFYRLLHRAQQVYLVYNSEGNTLGGGERSRYILQVQHELSTLPTITVSESNFTTSAHGTITTHPIAIPRTEAVVARIKRYVSEHGLSPSALNSYIHCELQFYLRYIAGWAQAEEIEESFEANTMGSAVHYALEHIYAPWVGKPLSIREIEAVLNDTDTIGRWIKEYLVKRFEEEDIMRGKNYLLYQVCLQMTMNVLRSEITLLQDKTIPIITIVGLEQKMEQRISIDDTPILLKGITDRIEQRGSDLYIADYKTGDMRKGNLAIDDFQAIFHDPEYAKSFQLLTYAWLYGRSYSITTGIGSGIYWLRDKQSKYEGVCYQGTEIMTTEILKEFRAGLNDLLRRLIRTEGDIVQTDDTERCAYCDFQRICGRDIV